MLGVGILISLFFGIAYWLSVSDNLGIAYCPPGQHEEESLGRFGNGVCVYDY